MRPRWKWIAVIAAVVASAIWIYWFNFRPGTTLRLHPTQNGSEAGKVSFDMHSSRLIKLVKPGYSIEVHSPAGSTSYRALFLGQGAFQSAGPTVLLKGSEELVTVATPINVDGFRVSIDLEEQSAFSSGLFRWVFNRPEDRNPFNRGIREWLVRTHHKGTPRTIRSQWVVRSNNVWMEKVER
jgi:hypothetical protein